MASSARTLVLVWAALLVLLALTIGATFLPIGPLKPAVNLGIAFAKAALIFWFYMHLREESGLVRLAAVGAGAWLLIMLMLMSSDFLARFRFGAGP
jgi:cytochrome c oxidase subunit 4